MSSRAGRTSEKRLKDSGKGKGKGSSVVSSVGGGRNPEQAKELGKETGEDESAMMSSARGDRTPEKQAKDAGEGTSKVTTRIGYIHNLSEVIRNKADTLDYCTLKLQTSDDKLEDALLYSPVKRKMLATNEQSRTGVKLQKLTYTEDGDKIIINDVTRITSPETTEYNFQYKDFQLKDEDYFSIQDILERAEEYDKVHVKEKLFEVKEKVVKNKDLKLASGLLSDGINTIPIDIWGPHCSSVKNECAYIFTDLIVRVWQGKKKVSVSRRSKVEALNDPELMEVKEDQVVKSFDDEIAIIDIDNISSLKKVEIFFTCINCKRKLNQVGGSQIVHCHKCGHIMKIERCSKSVIISFVVDRSLTLTAFKDSLENVLAPEAMEDKDSVEFGFLMLSGFYIHYNKRSHVVTKFVAQTSDS